MQSEKASPFFMRKFRSFCLFLSLFSLITGALALCSCKKQERDKTDIPSKAEIICGAEQCERYFPLLKDKHFALVVNQTSRIGEKHLVDSLCAAGLRPDFIFALEHGFRGQADAGAKIVDGKDSRSGLDIVSLYGKNKKPSPEHLQKLDYVVFDIQDVGCRFYTYLSSLHYIMEACAENKVKLLLLDRPNPNDFVDGPLLESDCRSFVGMHPIPVLHGCTLGEIARMINGEKWIGDSCALHIIEVKNWQHGQHYSLPVKPSPNLPNDRAIRLYPSLCLFEGSIVSVGRGTTDAFQMLGLPDSSYGQFSFTPRSLPSFDTRPMYQDQPCYGLDLRQDSVTQGFSLKYLIYFLERTPHKASFFSRAAFFDLLAGNHRLREQLLQGLSEEEIRRSWEADLQDYRAKRSLYLLYK